MDCLSHVPVRRCAVSCLLGLFVVCAATMPALGQATWEGTVDSDFTNGANWSNGTGLDTSSPDNLIPIGFGSGSGNVPQLGTLFNAPGAGLTVSGANPGETAALEIRQNGELTLDSLTVGSGRVDAIGSLSATTLNLGSDSEGGGFSEILVGGAASFGTANIGSTDSGSARLDVAGFVHINTLNLATGTSTAPQFGEIVVTSGGELSTGNAILGEFGDAKIVLGANARFLGGQVDLRGGQFRIGSGGAAPILFSPVFNGGFGPSSGTVVFNHNESGYVFEGILEEVGIDHTGTGTTIFDRAQRGSLRISNGAIQLGTGGTTGTFDGDIENNASLIINRSDTLVTTNDIGGSGTTTIQSGRLQIGNGGTEGSLLQDVVNNGELAFNRSDTLTVVGDVTGSGTTSIDSGRLQVGNGGTAGSINQDVINDSELAFFRSDDLVFDDVISGTGSLFKLGTNTLELSAVNTYTGQTVINGGTLLISGELTAGDLITINSAGTLAGTGLIDRDVSVATGGTLGTGLTILGSVTLDGAQVNVGDVVVGEDVVAAAGEQVLINNATGGSIDVTLGTASIDLLNGADVTTGGWGAVIEAMQSGSLNVTSGGSATVNSLAGGSISMDNANLLVQSGTFNGEISGSGTVRKGGTGQFTLQGPNLGFTGSFRMTEGTLIVGADGALGGLPVVYIDGDATLQIESGVNFIDGSLNLNPGGLVTKGFDNEDVGDIGTLVSDDTEARFIGGPVTANVSYEFTTVEDALVRGNAMAISGLNGTIHGLAMRSTRFPTDGDPMDFVLGWLDTSTGQWVQATDGNIGPDGSLAGFHNMSLAEFAQTNSGEGFDALLGAYGTDLASGEVWAIIDHNSTFAPLAIPEPGTVALLAIGITTLMMRRRAA